MDINWSLITAIGELVGAFGVILSLIYLARQIRAQNRESQIAAVHELNEAFRSAITSFQDPDLARVFSRAKNNFDSLNETERLQFSSYLSLAGVQRVWAIRKAAYSEGFREFVDATGSREYETK